MLLSSVGQHKSQPECVRPVACGWHVEENAAGRGGVEMTLPSLVSAYIDIIYRIYILSIYFYLILLGEYEYLYY